MKTLEITSYIGCPVGCSYCPQKTLLDAYKSDERKMMFKDFATLLNNVPRDVRIDFSGFSEIFYHPLGEYMILHAHCLDYVIVLYTTLEGYDIESDILTDVFFSDVFFHQHDGKNFNQEEFDKKMERFKSITKGFYRTAKLEPQWRWSRAGNLWGMERKKGKFICALANKKFNHNVVLPDGNVYLCCQDYGLKHKIGNLYETDYDNLDRETIQELSDQVDSEIICRFCEHMIEL